MATEHIAIEITDGIANTIPEKLIRISENARAAHRSITNLRNELSRLKSTGVRQLAQQLRSVTENTRQLSQAQNNASRSTANAALQQQRLETELERTATAQGRAATARSQAAAAATRAAKIELQAELELDRAMAQKEAALSRAALAALRLQQAQERAAASTNSLDNAAERLKRDLYPLYDAQARYNQAVDHALNLYRQGAIGVRTYTDAVNRAAARFEAAKTAIDRGSRSTNQFGHEAGLARHHLLNLGFQIQDIGVSLASGQNPFVVIVQQGELIAVILGQAEVGVVDLAKAVVKLLAPFLAVAAVIGTVVALLVTFGTEVSKSTDLAAYSRSLGATSEQLKQTSFSAITLTDTMHGLFKTIKDNAVLGVSFDDLWTKIRNGFIKAAKLGATNFAAIFAASKATYDAIIDVWDHFPNYFLKPINEALNSAIGGFEKFVNFAIDGINKLIKGINKLPGAKIELMDPVGFGRMKTDFDNSGKDLSSIWLDSFKSNFQSNQNSIDNFMKAWATNTVAAAKKRIVEQLGGSEVSKEVDKIYDDLLKPQREYNARVEASNKLLDSGVISLARHNALLARAKDMYKSSIDPSYRFNKELREQLEVLKALGPEQEVQRNIQTLRNKAMEDGVPLTQKMIDETKRLTQAVQEAQTYNSALNDVFADRQQKLEDLRISQQAYNDALMNGTIGLQQYSIAMQKANVDAANLKMQMGEGGFYEVMTAGLGQFVQNYQGVLAGLSQAWGNFFTGFVNGFADSIGRAIVYGEDLRQTLSNVAKQMMSELISALIKVGIQYLVNAALAQTAITTTTATSTAAAAQTTAAWAPAAAVTSAASFGGAAVAGIAALAVLFGMVIGFASKGFKTGGYTGNLGTNQIAGVTHGQEFVMNAAATKRNRPLLEAMNNGNYGAAYQGATVTPSNGSSSSPTIIFDIDNNIVVQGSGDDDSAASLEKAANAISQKTQSDIMNSIRMGGTWSKIIRAN